MRDAAAVISCRLIIVEVKLHFALQRLCIETCYKCRQGRYNLDPGVKFFATPPVHGSLCRFVDHPEDFCHNMPDSMTFEEGALIEPLANALFACMRARVGPGKSVAILGAGTMGEDSAIVSLPVGITCACTYHMQRYSKIFEVLYAAVFTETPWLIVEGMSIYRPVSVY